MHEFRTDPTSSVLLSLALVIICTGGAVAAGNDKCCQQPETTVAGDLERPKGPVLIFDMRSDSKTMHFVDSLDDSTWSDLSDFLGKPTNKTLKTARDHFTAVSADSVRVLWSAKASVTLLMLHTDPCPPIPKVTEQRRDTQLVKDLGALLKTVLGKLGGKAAEPEIKVSMSSVTLHETRATLTIAVRSIPKKTDSCDVTADACKDGSCVYQTATFITGPAEHIFLSVDVPLSKVGSLKYDTETKTLVPKDAQTKVYGGVNWMFGDVVEPSPGTWKKPSERLLIKAMIEVSATPSNSFGVALGYRPPRIDVGGFELDALQVWGGYIWVREDAVSSEGKPIENASYRASLRWGLSFNIAKLKDWLALK